jgi:hypothetical protein
MPKVNPSLIRKRNLPATARLCPPVRMAHPIGSRPALIPATGLFYVVASQSYSVFYLTAEGKAEGFAGRDDFLNFPATIKAIDYRTGDIRWTHDLGGMGAGLLTTAAKSDTPRRAGGLMSWAASKAVSHKSRRRAIARLC